jgi:ADP-heptose:LPS heptosyltransferase
MNDCDAQVIVFDSSHGGGPQEQWNIPGIVVVKDYKIRQVAALIDATDLMVTPDSGLMHIAGALNKKIVSIWAGSRDITTSVFRAGMMLNPVTKAISVLKVLR